MKLISSSTALIAVSLLLPSLTFSQDLLALKTTPESPLKITPSVKAFVNEMSHDYHFNSEKLMALMQQTKRIPPVIYYTAKPLEYKTWDVYRKIFITPQRIKMGVNYWNAHQQTLDDVSKKYGVPVNVIVAIIGVETNYGTNCGSFQEMGALSTLAFDYKPRSTFFRKELKEYLLLTRSQKIDPLKLKGSYAGALGIPQFMPSSYRKYGVDYSGNHSVNLLEDNADAIASIANYLKHEGWQTGQPIAVLAKTPEKTVKPSLISDRGFARTPLRVYEKHHITPIENINPNTKAALLEMTVENGKEYWFGFNNFRTIMDYNPRTTYAMAVFTLSKAIENAHK